LLHRKEIYAIDFHQPLQIEAFEKCSFLFKFKSKIPDFDRGKAKILTTGIHRVFRGLQFETDPRGIGSAFHRASAEIGQKGAICKDLELSVSPSNVL